MNRSRKETKLLHLHLLISVSAVLFLVSDGAGMEDDIRCLKGVKSTLKDPQGRLESWIFNNSTAGFICKFAGVGCWTDRENRLISLQLQSMELAGQVPDSIQYCPGLQTLDLSGNKISGPIPSDICKWLPDLVTLDLSRNDLSGSIPSELVNCKYLNALILSDNRLTGPIPYQLSRLDRLRKVSVSNNQLTGRIPEFFAGSNAADFDGNQLCGWPLESKCAAKKEKNLRIIITTGVLSAVTALLIGFGIWWWFVVRYERRWGGASSS